jgi:uncharacterized protein
MKIHVSRVSTDGAKESASLDPKFLDMGRFDISIEEPVSINALITKAATELVVQPEISCTLSMTCAKCLEVFHKKITAKPILSYKVGPTDVVDITDDVRQEIILHYPMIPICSASCKGLCPECGQNLNVKSCNHQKQE